MISRKNSALIIILVSLGFFVYAFNLNNSLFWDDDVWIKGNFFIHSFSYLKEIFTQNVEAGFGLSSNYYRPLLLLSFVFNYAIHGIEPLGFHLVSNGLHIANGVLIFILFSRFIGARASFLAALLFLIHPVQTEAVAYISGRGDPMSVFFMLLALWLFIKSLNFEAFKSKVYRSFSVVSVLLALLSRETAILFPLFLIIFYVSFIAKEKLIAAIKKSFVVSVPFFAISVFYFILRLTVFNFENTLNFYSQPNVYTENLFFRLYTFGHALIEYFKIILWPVGLHMERDLSIHTSFFEWPVWFGALIVLLIVFVGFLLFRKFKIKEPNSEIGVWFFGWAWFFVALGPVSGIIPINALIYEHWLYVPIIGLTILSGFYLDKLFSFLRQNYKILFVVLILSFGFYVSFLGFKSVKRNILWGKPIEFYEDILKYSPSSVRILTNLGKFHYEKGNIVKAVEFYEKAIETPDGKSFAEPYYNLGNIYRDDKKIDEAIKRYQKAIEVNPVFPFAYQNLAELYVNEKQDLASGIKVLEELKKIQPGNPRVYYNLGLIYLGTENIDLAIDNFEKGLELASGRDNEVETAIKEILNTIRQN